MSTRWSVSHHMAQLISYFLIQIKYIYFSFLYYYQSESSSLNFKNNDRLVRTSRYYSKETYLKQLLFSFEKKKTIVFILGIFYFSSS